MVKGVLVSAALVAGGLVAVSAQAEVLQTGRSTYLHHHHHASHYYHQTHRHSHVPHSAGASRDGRTTATGGNPGGYSDKN